MGNGQALAIQCDNPTPIQAGCTRLQGGVAERVGTGLVAGTPDVVVSKDKVAGSDRTGVDDPRAGQVAAMDEDFRAGIDQELDRTFGPCLMVMGVGEKADEHCQS